MSMMRFSLGRALGISVLERRVRMFLAIKNELKGMLGQCEENEDSNRIMERRREENGKKMKKKLQQQ